eukprot:4969235-Prymnesium_polylepis.1
MHVRASPLDEVSLPAGWLLCILASSYAIEPQRLTACGFLPELLRHGARQDGQADRAREETAWALASLAGKIAYQPALAVDAAAVTFLVQLAASEVRRDPRAAHTLPRNHAAAQPQPAAPPRAL